MSEETLRQRLEGSVAVISVERALPGAMLTARVLAITLRRLPIGLVVESSGLPREVAEGIRVACHRIDSRRALELTDRWTGEGVRVHVGTRSGSRSIRVAPDGYGAHVVRDATVDLRVHRAAHPLGSVFAAAMAAGEVFKDVAGVLENRRCDHPYLTWCPVALSHDLTLAPIQRGTLHLRLALAGCGAIGTAVALILQELDAEGDILLIDRQRFARENLATYSLGDAGSVRGRPWKVNLVGRHLSRYLVRTVRMDVADLPLMVDAGGIAWPRTVLGALDTPEARQDLQRLWPDHLIDGGTSDTAVGLHHATALTGPCLMCFFPPRSAGTTVDRLAHLTGLTVERLGRGDDPLMAKELEGKTAEQQALLQPMVGKPVCGLARALGLVGAGDDGYLPAVPFVAQQAACHVVGRLLAIHLGVQELPNFFAYDSLIGPRPDAVDHRRPAAHCYCQERPELIRDVRTARGAVSESA